MDIGVSPESLSDPDSFSDENFEVVIRDINFKTILDNINEDRYYNKLVKKVTADEIYLMEKLYIEGSWATALTIFSDSDLGVNVDMSIYSVDYFTEGGKNINVETLGIVDALRNQELSDIV